MLTLCLSMCKGLRLGSYSSRCGSKLTGDCLRPLLHSDHSGLIKPQKAGPGMEREQDQITICTAQHTIHIHSNLCVISFSWYSIVDRIIIADFKLKVSTKTNLYTILPHHKPFHTNSRDLKRKKNERSADSYLMRC